MKGGKKEREKLKWNKRIDRKVNARMERTNQMDRVEWQIAYLIDSLAILIATDRN